MPIKFLTVNKLRVIYNLAAYLKELNNLDFFRWHFFKPILIAFTLLGLTLSACANSATDKNWPLWSDFKTKFVQSDGRVIASGAPNFQSFSEGQSYAMFFALVANDQASFERIWHWTKENLMGNNVNDTLPAWLWGVSEDGHWGVIDHNSASDADIWIAYSLLEAGRLWKNDTYASDALKMITKIEAVEVVTIPSLGKFLLPGQLGFIQVDKHLTQFNPSYMPLPVLRRLALASPQGPWDEIATNTVLMLSANNPKGFAVDWLSYENTPLATPGFIVDPLKSDRGSYDAIRVYLWAGMTSKKDPLAVPLMKSLVGITDATLKNGAPPEVINVQQGTFNGIAPIGFSAALLPYFKANNQTYALNKELARVNKKLDDISSTQQLEAPELGYYDHVLCLFGMGWMEKRYQFMPSGKLNN